MNKHQILSESEQEAYSETKKALGNVLQIIILGRKEEAIQILNNISKEKKDILKKHNRLNFYWHRFMGSAFEKNKEPAKAIKFYKKALEIDNNDAFSAFKISRLSLSLGKKQDAQKYSNHAKTLEPDNQVILALENKIKKIDNIETVSPNTRIHQGQNKQYDLLSWNAITFEAGLRGAVGHPINKQLAIAPSGGVFFSYFFSPFLHAGIVFDFYYNKNTVKLSVRSLPLAYQQTLLFYSGAAELGLSFIIKNTLRITTGVAFGYYFGSLALQNSSQAQTSISNVKRDIKNPMLSSRISLSWLFLSHVAFNLNIRYIGYLDGPNGFDKAIHFFDAGIGVSYVY